MMDGLDQNIWDAFAQLTQASSDPVAAANVIATLWRDYTSGKFEPQQMAFVLGLVAGRRVGHAEGFSAGHDAGEAEATRGMIDHIVAAASSQPVPAPAESRRSDPDVDDQPAGQFDDLVARLASGKAIVH